MSQFSGTSNANAIAEAVCTYVRLLQRRTTNLSDGRLVNCGPIVSQHMQVELSMKVACHLDVEYLVWWRTLVPGEVRLVCYLKPVPKKPTSRNTTVYYGRFALDTYGLGVVSEFCVQWSRMNSWSGSKSWSLSEAFQFVKHLCCINPYPKVRCSPQNTKRQLNLAKLGEISAIQDVENITHAYG